MQAIQTKYLGPTNAKGARIKAWCERGSISVHYPHELSGEAVHRFAVDCLVARFCDQDLKQYGTPPEKNPWKRPYVTGGLPNGDYAHVFVEDSTREPLQRAAEIMGDNGDMQLALHGESITVDDFEAQLRNARGVRIGVFAILNKALNGRA